VLPGLKSGRALVKKKKKKKKKKNKALRYKPTGRGFDSR
jgi:hypothetical protein